MMALVETPYRMTDMSTKWGLVTVHTETGRVDRQFRIPGPVADAVAKFNRLPPQISEGEWKAGRVVVSCRPCKPGQCALSDDGWLALNAGIDESVPRQISVRLYFIPPAQWSEANGVVFLEQTVFADIGDPWPSPF